MNVLETPHIIDSKMEWVACEWNFFTSHQNEILDEIRRLNGGHIGGGLLFFPTKDAKLLFVLKYQG